MTFFPFQRLVVRTTLPPAELLERLAAQVEAKRWWRSPLSKPERPFQGSIQGDTFEISRIINYRNSFLPIIKGTVRPDEHGSMLEANLRLHAFVLVFMAFWMSMAATGFGGTVAFSLSRAKLDASPLIPLVMLIFGYVLTMGGFLVEASKARKLLEGLAERNGT